MFDNQNNNSEEENFLSGKGKENSFAVPDGYFDQLSDRIISKIEIAEELNGLNVLSELPKNRIFDVPADYFKSSENALEYQYELSTLEQLSKISKPVLKENEATYVDAVSEKVLKRIEITEELQEFSILSTVDKKNNFAVAPEYFETVVGKVKEKYYSVQHKQTSFFSRLLAHVLKPKIAFAYSIIFILGISLIYYKSSQQKIEPVSGDCKTLACLEKREMLNEHTIRDLNDDNLYEMVDVDALNKQLATDSAAINPDAAKNKMDSTNRKNN